MAILESSALHIVIVGHVDHGKSTLIGRLFYETGLLPEGKKESLEKMCAKRGVEFEWSFLMDALQAERDQGITIDISQIGFQTKARNYILIDAPGHKEFIKNMITGAAQSDAALLIIDAAEGMQEQSRRHAYLLHLIGVRQITVIVNKMDQIDYDEERFEHISQDVKAYFAQLDLSARHIIPASAKKGDMIATLSKHMDWYQGLTLIEALDDFPLPAPISKRELRLPIQDVYKFDARRILVGRIESGILRVGDELMFSPVNKVGKVKTIESWGSEAPIMKMGAGFNVGFTLDEQIFIERGQVASGTRDMPLESDVFRANIFWLSDKPLKVGQRLGMKINTTQTKITVQVIRKIIDTDNLDSAQADRILKNQVAEVILRSDHMLAFDEFAHLPHMGRFVLIDDYDFVGGGIISMEGFADQRRNLKTKSTHITRVPHTITSQKRERKQKHKGGVIWLTGLSGSGKSTLALALEQELFGRDFAVYVLDGDNIRHGLNRNLGFSPEDRAENIRRIGEVAALFERAGLVAITSFISPYRADRKMARQASSHFHEIYIKASLEDCEKRDPKGLYQKARSGEIKNFTGISAPYEYPIHPELIIDTCDLTIEESVAILLDYVESHFKI